MPTYSSALLPTTNGLTFGSAALRWTAYLQDLDIAGVSTITGRLAVKNLEDIRFADQYTGTVTQQLDGAITDVVTGLVVAPSTMGAGSPTTINSAQYLLDLRSGVFKLYCGNTSTPQLNVTSGGVAAQVYTGSNANPASAGLLRLAKIDALNFRNNANGADINGLSLDTSDVVQVGGAAGAKTIGPFAVSGAVTGITNLSYSGQITSSVATGTAPLVVASTTVVPSLNVATLNGVTVSGTPAASGYSLVSTSTSAAAWSNQAGTYKLENMQYTPVTFVSSAGGAYFTYTLPANELAVGQALRISVSGYWGNSSGGVRTYVFTLKAGATTLGGNSIPVTTGAVVASHWSFEYLIICTAAGSGGTVEVQNIVPAIALSGTTNPTGLTTTVNTATIAFDTTTSQSLTFNVVQTNDATTTSTGRQFMVERLG